MDAGTAHSPRTAIQVRSKAQLHSKTSRAKAGMESHASSMKWARAEGGAEAWLAGCPRPASARAEWGFSSALLSEPVLILPYGNIRYQHNAATRTLCLAKQARYFYRQNLYPSLTLALMSTRNTKAEKFSLCLKWIASHLIATASIQIPWRLLRCTFWCPVPPLWALL